MEEIQIWNVTGKIQGTEIKYQLTIQQQQLKFMGKSGIAKTALYELRDTSSGYLVQGGCIE